MSKTVQNMCYLQDMIDALETETGAIMTIQHRKGKVILVTGEYSAEFRKISNATDYIMGIITGFAMLKEQTALNSQPKERAAATVSLGALLTERLG